MAGKPDPRLITGSRSALDGESCRRGLDVPVLPAMLEFRAAVQSDRFALGTMLDSPANANVGPHSRRPLALPDRNAGDSIRRLGKA